MDVQTTGSFEDENEEALIDRTFGEGEASTFDLGLPASDLHSPGGEPAGDESDREVEEDFDDGVSARIPGKAEVQKESTLEDGVPSIWILNMVCVYLFGVGLLLLHCLTGHRQCWLCDAEPFEGTNQDGGCS